MSAWVRMPWRKLHFSFVTSVKLRGIGSDARSILATMIASSWWDGEADEGRVYVAEGVPMKLVELFDNAEVKPKAGKAAWAKLMERRVVALAEDGAPALLNFREHQLGSSTTRTRKHKERGAGVPDALPKRSRNAPRTTEEEAEAEADREQTPPPDPGRLVRTRPAPSSGLFHELDMLRRTLSAELQADLPSWGGSGGQAVDGIGRALDELGGDLDALRAVIRHTAELVAAGKIEPVLFRRMWVGDGFGARLDAWRAAKPANRPERKATPAELAELEAVRASADEFLASMKVESA